MIERIGNAAQLLSTIKSSASEETTESKHAASAKSIVASTEESKEAMGVTNRATQPMGVPGVGSFFDVLA
jgi:hypothetical protein